jgi:ribosome-binding protein aMBF1 (putative translation factor)
MPKPLHSRQYKRFLKELRAARAWAGVSQVELAARIGEPQSYISKCESGARRLDVIELYRWTSALDIDLVDFVVNLEGCLEFDRSARPVRQPKA